jgi:hypothetical protein
MARQKVIKIVTLDPTDFLSMGVERLLRAKAFLVLVALPLAIWIAGGWPWPKCC